MKGTKTLCVLLSSCILASGLLGGCGGSKKEKLMTKEEIETAMPSDSLKLFTGDSLENEFIGFGTEIDPQFLQFNVGRSGVNDSNESWACKKEDWENVFVPRMREMNLKKIRVMLLPSWFATSESVYKNKSYTYDSLGWQSLEMVLSTAQELGMYVNVTMWGIDAGAAWMGEPMMNGQWMTIPNSDEVFCNVFADALEYLINEKGYNCIKEITPYNEPDTVFRPYLGETQAFPAYADLCYKLDEVMKERNLRKSLKFNLSDDANRISWLSSSVLELSDIADYFNTHTYSFGKDTTNEDMLGNEAFGAFGKIQDEVKESKVPHMFGEFGTNSTQPPNGCVDRYDFSRGIDVSRIAINALNSGSVGLNYWVLFSQFYSTTTNFSDIMSMGLWGFADELYRCRPVYYAYSLLTRFTEAGSKVYPIQSSDSAISAVALKDKNDKWVYLVVNTADKSSKLSFGNLSAKTGDLAEYCYSSDENYADGVQIASNGTITSAGQIITLQVSGNSFTVLTEK